MELNKETRRTFVVLIAFALLVTWGLFRPEAMAGIFHVLGSVLTPFVLGLSIAFIVNLLLRPVERGWERVVGIRGGGRANGLKRPISIFVSVFLIVTAFFVLLFIVLPEVVGTIVVVVDALPQYAAKIEMWWAHLAANAGARGVVLPPLHVNVDEWTPTVTNWLTEQAPAFLSKTLGFTTSVLTGLFNVVVGLVFALYVLADKERLADQARRVLLAFLPRRTAGTVMEVADLAHTTFAKFVTGQLTDAFIVGVLCYIGMLVLTLPHAAAVSILVGVTTIVPVIGVLLGTAIGALLIVVVDPVKALWFLIFIVVLQQLESNFIYPKVVGKSVGLPGIWVLAAIIIGGSTFGVIGMLLGVPIASVLYALLRQSVRRRLAQRVEGEDGA